ncbi:vang-like protein 2-B [Octopus bimaculoides]|uniref:Vang-like protein n=1 Tax=Octopus bimaculoides TaxID=37653 RepID=A0A0L8FGX6_OCTBM|nr:vang-like protein 2-B [Octopus bimaculoides]XP_014789925.1 vang-like protein 2-B [Octopus bimaculoides]XP_052830957.1 vang-like protein 2-B [Octopus bimaculoides]|eukprot:XP_014789924.1 PREDICTED: vang-like protein 2-B [Octopus bimaculoides]
MKMMDGAESVRSGKSDRSERSHRSHGSMHHRHHQRQPSNRPHRSQSRDKVRGGDEHIDDRAVQHRDHHIVSGEDECEERIEVQILPQDDNWGDNTTAITGNTSETAFSMEDMHKFSKDLDDSIGFDCTRYVGTALATFLSLFGFASPIIMVILPKLGIMTWDAGPCKPECEGLLISFTFKLIILLMGTMALFFRHPKATMPRVYVFRAVVLFLVFVLTFAFWLFYGVRIFKRKDAKTEYYNIVQFSVSLVDALLFIHYLSIIVLEIRQLQPQYVVKVVRSPDGLSQNYNIGILSIQRAAVSVLENYYKDFPVFNPYLENVHKRSSKVTSLKIYDVDGVNTSGPQGRQRAVFAPNSRRRDTSHNERFYEEQEYERRVRKRKARLIMSADEAFTHIKRMQDEQGPAIPMDPYEAAQAVFPSMARALQKYLRVTRQQPRYTMEAVLQHLATCISHDVSPKAFVEKYLTQGAVIMNEKDYKGLEKWVLVCDHLLTREIEHGIVFQLRQGELSLLCSVHKLPHFSLTEEVIDPKHNKFVLRLNSETSV